MCVCVCIYIYNFDSVYFRSNLLLRQVSLQTIKHRIFFIVFNYLLRFVLKLSDEMFSAFCFKNVQLERFTNRVSGFSYYIYIYIYIYIHICVCAKIFVTLVVLGFMAYKPLSFI